MKRKLVLENGVEFIGTGFGSTREAISEIVFNTSMVGYQEILSDPSYTDQIVLMTYPLIGNYGITDEDYESKIIGPRGLIVREYNDKPSNFRYTKTVNELLEENDVAAISHIDTRMLTRIIRDNGSMLAIICDLGVSTEEAVEKINAYKAPNDQVSRVSSRKTWYSRCSNHKYNVVAVDCGCKYNIIRKLNEFGCNVTVVPYNTPYEKIINMKPDGLFISNGPGDPSDVKEVVELIKSAQGNVPIFGICLGHQLLALANGLETYKMKFGHRGGNHPVKNLLNGKVEITSQNHSYAVAGDSIKDENLEVTHLNILDNTIEGIRIKKDYAFSVQYHPESCSGPEDSEYLFGEFINNMKSFAEGR